MTTIGGNNITYTAGNLVGSEGDIIIRTPTADSIDTFPTAALLYAQFGVVGSSFSFKIVNNSDFVITNQEGTGITLIPDPNGDGTSVLQARTANDYLIVLTSTTTADIFNLSYNGTPIVAESITTVVNTISPNMVLEDPGVGTNTVTFSAPDPVPTSYTFTVPDTPGGLNQVLTTDGSGNMSWSNSVLSSTGPSTDNAVIRWDGTVGNSLQNSGVIIDDTDNITGVASLVSSGLIRSNTSFVLEDPAAGTNTVTLQAPTLAASYSLTLPIDDGQPNEALVTDGSGGLSWTTSLTTTLNDGDIYVGNGSNVATGVTMSGDATIINTGALTISNNAITTVKILDSNVTNAKLANDSLTVTAGDGLQNGGSVALGASTTLDVDSTVIRTTGAQSMSGPKTFTDSILLEDPGAGANTITLQAPTLGASYSLTLPVDDGTPNQVLTTNGSGVLTWDTPAASGITSINGLTAASQTLVTGTTGTDFNIDSTGSVHTFNLPTASGTNTGKLSNTDWNTFNNKLTGTLTDSFIFVGNGSNIATGVAMSGDATISNSGVMTIEDDAITTDKILNGNVTNVKLANSTIGLLTGTTGSDINVSGTPASLGGDITLNVPDASATARGVVTTGPQTFAGDKTFDEITMDGPIDMVNTEKMINLPLPTASGDAANKAYVDSVAGGNPGGITDSIQFRLSGGTFGGSADWLYNDTNKLVTLAGKQLFEVSSFSGTPSLNGSQIEVKAQTYTDNTGGPTTTNAVFTSFAKPTLAASNPTTTTNVATVYIAGDPIAGTNETFTNTYALWVDEGLTRFDENIDVGGNVDSAGTIQGVTITDGTGTLTSGNFTGLNSLTATTLGDGVASMNSGTLTGLLPPLSATDAANKAYVDSVAFGLSFKDACRVATTNNIVLTGLQTVDGVSLSIGDRVLVKDQSNAVENGIYVADSTAWTRSSDLPNGSDAAGAAVLITQGSTQSNSGWVCNNDTANDTVGTDPLFFVQFSGAGTIVAGEGLTLSGNILDVNVDDSTIEIVSDSLQVKNGGITSTQIGDDQVITQKIPDGAVTNVKLANSSVVVTAGDGLQNGGTAVLGSSISLDVDATVVRTFGGQSIGGIKTFTDTSQSFSSSTGAVIIDGGLGIKKDLFSDGRIETIGTIQGATLTDGTITISGGTISNVGALNATTLTATGAVTGGSITDGTAVMTGGSINSLINLNASGTVTSTNISDGTATLSGGTLTGLIAPTNDSDAANKAYVDAVASGLIWKDPCRVATDGNTALTGLPTIDGVTVIAGDRILVRDQTNEVENGIYVAAAGAWSRSADMGTGVDAQNFATLVQEGTVYSGSSWTVTGVSPFTVDTSDIIWTQFASTTTLSAGNGLDITGNTINVLFDDVTIGLDSNTLEVKDSGITSTQIADNAVINSKILNDAVTTDKILDANVTNAKLANSTIGLNLGTTGSDINVTGSPASLGGAFTLNVPDATATARGVVNAIAQTFSGDKTFNNTVTAVGALRSNNSLILEDPGAGTTAATLQAANATANYTLTLPTGLATAQNQVLTSDTSGNTSWQSRGFLQYDAIVSAVAGEGDFTTLSAAVTSGAISIYIREGTYNETTTITLPPNVHLIGENKTTTVINFGATAGQLLLQPAAGPGLNTTPTGTIAITNSSTAVTGTNTAFTTGNALSPGDFILIGDSYHRILTVNNATSLTLETAYEGPDITGQRAIAGTFAAGTLQNFSVTGGNTNSLITLQQCINTDVRNVGFLNSAADGLEIIDSTQILVSTCVMVNSSDDGISITGTESPGSCTQINVCQSIIKNSGTNGIHLITNTRNIILDSINITNSGGGGESSAGVQVEASNNDLIQITDSTCNYNEGKGINTESGSGQIVIQACTCAFNSVDGIDYDGVFNIINGCTLSNNGRYGLRGGQNGLLTNNVISNNANDGMSLIGDNNCVGSGCQIRNNGRHGIGDLSGNNTIIIGCAIEGNTSNGIEIIAGGSEINIVCCSILSNVIGVNIIGSAGTPSENNTITSNTIRQNTTGLLISADSQNNVIIGSTIVENTTNITDNGVDTTFWALGLGNNNIIRDITNFTNTTVSSSPTTGALVVTGGVGIGGALNVGGAVDVGSNLISSVTDPVAAQDAATKNYVDNFANPLCSIYDGTGTEIINATLKGVVFDSSDIIDTGTFNVIVGTYNNGTAVEILTTGRYQVSYYVGAEIANTTGGARCSVETTVQTGPSSTGPWTTKPGTIGGFYVREATDDFGTGKTYTFDITAGTFIRVTMDRLAGTTNSQTKPNSSSLNIMKVG